MSRRAVYWGSGRLPMSAVMWPPRDAVYHAASTLKRGEARLLRASRVSSADASGPLAAASEERSRADDGEDDDDDDDDEQPTCESFTSDHAARQWARAFGDLVLPRCAMDRTRTHRGPPSTAGRGCRGGETGGCRRPS
jgi:hypothetical protein